MKVYKQPTPPEMNLHNVTRKSNPRGKMEAAFWELQAPKALGCYLVDYKGIDHETNPPCAWLWNNGDYVVLAGEPPKFGASVCRELENRGEPRELERVGIWTDHNIPEPGLRYFKIDVLNIAPNEKLKIDMHERGKRWKHIWKGDWNMQVIPAKDPASLPRWAKHGLSLAGYECPFSTIEKAGMGAGVVGISAVATKALGWW